MAHPQPKRQRRIRDGGVSIDERVGASMNKKVAINTAIAMEQLQTYLLSKKPEDLARIALTSTHCPIHKLATITIIIDGWRFCTECQLQCAVHNLLLFYPEQLTPAKAIVDVPFIKRNWTLDECIALYKSFIDEKQMDFVLKKYVHAQFHADCKNVCDLTLRLDSNAAGYIMKPLNAYLKMYRPGCYVFDSAVTMALLGMKLQTSKLSGLQVETRHNDEKKLHADILANKPSLELLKNAEYLFFPLVEDEHWVLYMISRLTTIYVFDSKHSAQEARSLHTFDMAHFDEVLRGWKAKPSSHALDMAVAPAYPLQKDAISCGYHVWCNIFNVLFPQKESVFEKQEDSSLIRAVFFYCIAYCKLPLS